MRKFYAILGVLLSLSTFCGAKVVEMQNMNELYQHLELGTVVIFDIDNTLIQPVQELGSDQWSRYRSEELMKQGIPKQEAIETMLDEWRQIQGVTDSKLSEPGVDEILSNLQQQGYLVMGLTARGFDFAVRTREQLQEVGIDLTKTDPSDRALYFENEMMGVMYYHGILFAGGSPKGEALERLLCSIEFNPRHVILVDDRKKNLLSMEKTCEELDIPSVGLCYGFLDEKVQNLREHITEIQQKFFGLILSDEAAEQILEEQEKAARD